jgi:hypothetical protein
MSDPSNTDIDALLERMWQDYLTMNPQARAVRDLFESRGERVVNDHIALRTFDLDPVGIDTLARPFLASGYRELGSYRFPVKKLRARHFGAPGKPLVFISELLVEEFEPEVRAIIRGLVEQVDPARTEGFDFCTSGRPWSLDQATWRRLAQVSEYAAWVAAHGFRPNHFTVLVNRLQSVDSLEAVNALLKEHGFELNDAGGEIKGSPEQLLEQSSTMANVVRVSFDDGALDVPGCYYEFARRYTDAAGDLYQGFIAASADRIFESTDRR